MGRRLLPGEMAAQRQEPGRLRHGLVRVAGHRHVPPAGLDVSSRRPAAPRPQPVHSRMKAGLGQAVKSSSTASASWLEQRWLTFPGQRYEELLVIPVCSPAPGLGPSTRSKAVAPSFDYLHFLEKWLPRAPIMNTRVGRAQCTGRDRPLHGRAGSGIELQIGELSTLARCATAGRPQPADSRMGGNPGGRNLSRARLS